MATSLKTTLAAVPVAALLEMRDTIIADSRLPYASLAGLAAIAASAYVFLRSSSFIDGSGIVSLGGTSSIAAWEFFSKRHDFIFNGLKKTGQKLYQFQFLQHTVVVISGEEARKVFHDDKWLDITQGYQILSGGVSGSSRSSQC
jgi:sterol 14-demethylase